MKFHVTFRSKASSQLLELSNVFEYDDFICIGELIRNICVNFGIDPDTMNGYTLNIKVFVVESEISRQLLYNPNNCIRTLSIQDNQVVSLIFEEIL
jgi:hypothetical protein